MKAFGRRQFLQAVAGSAALWPLRKLLSQNTAGIGSGPGAGGGKPGKPLKAVIVYYSATGSTFKVAKAICQGMRKTMSCDLVKIKKADPKKMAQYDVIGLGGPIWYYRDTANLKLFLNKMPMMEGKPAFLFCTHGSEPIGFFDSLGQTAMKRKLTIIGWNDWYGSVFHVLHMPKPYLTDGHPDAIDLAQAEAFGDEMADRARSFLAGDLSAIPDVPQGPGADPLWIRRDISESQRGPGPKVGSAYGDGVDAAVALKAKIQIPGSKPAATASATPAGGAVAMAVGAFGEAGSARPSPATGASNNGPSGASGGGPGARPGGASAQVFVRAATTPGVTTEANIPTAAIAARRGLMIASATTVPSPTAPGDQCVDREVGEEIVECIDVGQRGGCETLSVRRPEGPRRGAAFEAIVKIDPQVRLVAKGKHMAEPLGHPRPEARAQDGGRAR